MNFTTTTKSNHINKNSVITPDNFTSIQITNIGTADAVINDNIPLPAGASWTWENKPYVIIKSEISVKFKTDDAGKDLLIQKFFFTEVKK
jgi:hypothetical protein